MRVSIGLGFVLATLLAVPASGADKTARKTDCKVSETKAAAAAGKVPAAPAMTIHVDPNTGELRPAPAAAAGDAAAVTAPSPDLSPLATQESPVEGGGQMVVLDDRFMLEMTATVAPGGEVRHVCRTEEAKKSGSAKKTGAKENARPSKEVRREP